MVGPRLSVGGVPFHEPFGVTRLLATTPYSPQQWARMLFFFGALNRL
jgi:hypothetical protein